MRRTPKVIESPDTVPDYIDAQDWEKIDCTQNRHIALRPIQTGQHHIPRNHHHTFLCIHTRYHNKPIISFPDQSVLQPPTHTVSCQKESGNAKTASGVLTYYEIQAISTQVQLQRLKLNHDKEAAVQNLGFDSNQWVSYNDSETFKQEIDWADGVGFGGSVIRVLDTDDDKYTAISALPGKVAVYS